MILGKTVSPIASNAGTQIHRQPSKGEQMFNQAQSWLLKDTNIKTEVDVLKAALWEIKAGKSISFNEKEGGKRIDNLVKIFGLTTKATAGLKTDWAWLVRNRKDSGKKSYQTKEQAFFRIMQSPLTKLSDQHPKSQAKFWLKNTPPQVVDILYDVADATLPVEELYAYAAKEGLIEYVRNEIGLFSTDEPSLSQLRGVQSNKAISGFDYLGLDDFMTELNASREPLRRFLPGGFDLTQVSPLDRTNEKGRVVHSGKFPNLKMAIQALAAMLKRRRKLFLEDAKQNEYTTPTNDELVYWTYVYFNSGKFGGKEQ
ncbi:hypothetical protein ACEYW6_27445 [Nostoc sp. UIC 10607]|uniref:hypothetical protein n=1 Tax=Nostoc sp. UIC 10607 TaxID=3045935 RepID=UPI00399F5124